jgi:hypothetical protein
VIVQEEHILDYPDPRLTYDNEDLFMLDTMITNTPLWIHPSTPTTRNLVLVHADSGMKSATYSKIIQIAFE